MPAGAEHLVVEPVQGPEPCAITSATIIADRGQLVNWNCQNRNEQRQSGTSRLAARIDGNLGPVKPPSGIFEALARTTLYHSGTLTYWNLGAALALHGSPERR